MCVCVYIYTYIYVKLSRGMSGLRNGMNTTQLPPSPASRAGTDLPTNGQAVSRAVHYVNTHRPKFQVRPRPSYPAH